MAGLVLFGGARGANNLVPSKRLPDVADNASSVVPRIYGRVWHKPPLLLGRTSPGTWSSSTKVGGGVASPGGRVECIFGLGQIGVTLRGIRVAGVTVGLRKNGAGVWVPEGGGDVLGGLVLALSCYDATTTFVPSSPSGPYYRYDYQWAPIELITNAAAPWGKRTNGVASTTSGGVTPLPAWTDVGGASLPAWAWLEGTDAEGLAYAQVATLRCAGAPLINGKLPDFEVLVDGVGGVDASPVDVVRDLYTSQMRIPSGKVITNVGPDGATASSYEAWCAAMAGTLKVNCAVNGDPRAQLEDLLRVTCAESVPLLNGGVRVQPYADTPVGAYVPPSTAYVVESEDIVDDVVEMEERPQEECHNSVVVAYTDPSFPKTQSKLPVRDDLDIAETQERKGPTISSEFICSPGHAQFVGEHEVLRSLRIRKSWPKLTLTSRFLRLEQGDLLEVRDPKLPMSVVRVKKRDIDAGDRWKVIVETEEWSGDTHPLDITPDVPSGLAENPQSAAEVEVIRNAQQAQVVAAEAQTVAAAAQAAAAAASSAASSAASAASAAQASASSAISQLTDIASDSLLSPVEKPQVIREHAVLTGEQAGIDAQADAFSVSRAAYDTAVSTLASYLGGLSAPVAWNNLAGNTTIVGATFRTRFADVYTARQSLLNAIYAAARARADAAQGTANTASSAASAAQGTANTAAANASAALAQLTDIASDGVLTPGEKPAIVQAVAVITAEYAGIDAQAAAAGITTARGAYQGAYSTLVGYLAGGPRTPVPWDNLTGNTTIDGAMFRGYFQEYYARKQALLDAISGGIIEGTVVAGRVQTANYSEDEYGNPTEGAKLDKNGTALKVAPGNLRIGSRTLNVFLQVVRSARVYRNLGGFWSSVLAGFSSASRYDRGSSATPRYVVRLVPSAGVPLEAVYMVTPGLMGATVYMPVVVGISGGVDVGLWDATSHSWVDPNTTTWDFHVGVVSHDPYS